MNRTTLDLDNCSSKKLEKIFEKIRSCKDFIKGECELSPSMKGFHASIWCKKLCYLCRIRFDDIFRLNADLCNRALYQQNILFDKKVKVHAKRKKI